VTITRDFSFRDKLHDAERKLEPDKHWPGILKFEKIDREMRMNFCSVCAHQYNVSKYYIIDYRNDCLIKRNAPIAPTES